MRFEDERKRKPARRRRRGPMAMFMGILVRLFLLILVTAAILYILPVGLFMVESGADVSPSADLPSSALNILLLGVDKLNAGTQRSDTIIIASIGGNSLKLTSVLRDTMVDIPGHGMNKVNSAYSFGGAELAMRTLNRNFGLNITKYAVVDFTALADVINALGGVDIAITQAEQVEINKNVADSWKVFRRLGYKKTATTSLAADFTAADENGNLSVHLDGFQALGYARIRHIDSDFTRAFRQRKLMNAALKALRKNWYNPIMLVKLIKAADKGVETNVNALEIASLSLKALTCESASQLRLPVDNTYTDNGSALTNVDYGANLKAFMEFVY